MLLLATNANRAARAATGTGVCPGALAVDGEAACVPDATVALDFDQSLDVHADCAAQIAFYRILFVHGLANAVDLFLGQVVDASVGVDIGLRNDLLCAGRPDTINIGKSHFYPL